jgi:regulatory protein
VSDHDWLDEPKSKKNKRGFKKEPQELDESAMRRKTVELLARREYSYAELEKKLIPLNPDEMVAYAALDWLIENGLQSDERFANMYVRSKAISGYGPIRIRMELNQKGVKEHLIEQAFEETEEEVDWDEEVDRLILKKAKSLDFSEPKDKNKVMGYLQRRGFNLNQIYSGLDRYKRED